MRDFSTLFAVYTPVYIYAFLVLYFAAYMAVSTPKGSPNTLSSFFAANKTWFHRFVFFSIILSMLGTPPTLGFFGKMLTFYLLAQNPGAQLLAALVFTLFLLIFYLQSIRANAYAKRRHNYRSAAIDLYTVTFILYGQLVLIGFALFLPVFVDILAAFFM